MFVVTSLGLFVLAGLCKIGGAYLVWLWFREGRSLVYGIVGTSILILYGIIPTFQPAHFCRVYAAYGGMLLYRPCCGSREFGDRLHTFSCLSVLHNAVVAWNTQYIGRVVEELRTEGHALDEATLSLTTPLLHKHINPYGRYHFDVDRMRQTLDPVAQGA